MSSPFPGMDPYLEEPSQWPGVHQRLITYTADAMQPMLRPRYHVLIGERVYNRAAQGWAVYCIPLQRRLPRIGIPLRKPDPDVVLDSQAIFSRCYDNGGYEDFIDYRRPPVPPLGFSDTEWAELWLKDTGKR